MFSGNHVWNNTGLTQSLFGTGNATISYTGTIPQTNDAVGIGLSLKIADGINSSANTGDVEAGLISLEVNAGANGGRTAFQDIITINDNTSQTAAREFVAGRDSVNVTGPSGTYKHYPTGRTTAVVFNATATGYSGCVGYEVARYVSPSTPVDENTGIYIMRYAGGASQGTSYDRDLGFWMQDQQSSINGAKTAISFGPQGQDGRFFGVATTGKLIEVSKGSTDGLLTIDTGLDFSAISTFTTDVINTGPFRVSGAGRIYCDSMQAISGTNTPINLYGKGNAGININNITDGILCQILNNSPGTPVTSYIVVQAGQGGGAFLGVSGSATNASLNLQAKGAGVVALAAGNAAYVDVSGNTVATSYQVGNGSGPTWSTGSGVPVSTMPRGSLYSRTGGGVGTTLYVSQGGGTWNAVAGV